MTPTLGYKQSLAKSTGSGLLLANVTRFGELFSRWRHWTKGGPPWDTKVVPGHIGDERMVVGSHCAARNVDGLDSLHVEANQALVNMLSESMLALDRDEIYFELIQRSDGVLLVAKYNIILGSRWLALFGSDVIEEISHGSET